MRKLNLRVIFWAALRCLFWLALITLCLVFWNWLLAPPLKDVVVIILGTLALVAACVIGFIIHRAWKKARPSAMTLGWVCEQLRKEREEGDDWIKPYPTPGNDSEKETFV